MKNRTRNLASFGLIMVLLALFAGAILAVMSPAADSPVPAMAILAGLLVLAGTGLRALNQTGAVGFGGDGLHRLWTMKLTHTLLVTAGQIAVVGGRVVEACDDYAANTEGVYIYRGKRVWPKENPLVIAAWAQVYWDATNNQVTTTVAGNTPIGFCVEAAASTDAYVTFLLLPLANGSIGPPALKTRAVVALADAAATLTAAQMIDSSIFTITPSTARALTTDTAANLVAGCKGCQVGTTFDFSISCLAAFAVTLGGGSSVTLVGSGVLNNAAGSFRARFTNVTPGAEAVTIYRI